MKYKAKYYILFLLLCFNSIFGEIKESDKITLGNVVQKIIYVINNDIKDFKISPVFSILDTASIEIYVKKVDESNIKIFISSLTFDSLIKGNPDKLSFIIGHELAHVICGHFRKQYLAKNKFTSVIYSREDEREADLEGIKLALKAGYSYSEIIKLLKDFKTKGDYSPLEALSSEHPSWTQRLAYIDSSRTYLWRSMSTFETGVYFLFFENYEASAVCFEKVIDEFPNCYEAYANCGYAYLMRYIDGFDLDDVKQYNIGQIVVGGFYRRPNSLEIKLKGINENLWYDAVSNFEKALSYYNNLALVKSNLGIAYLLDPRKKSLSRAKRYFDEALELIKEDTTLDPILKGVICLNSGASNLVDDSLDTALKNINSAKSYFNDLNTNSDDMRLAGVSQNNPSSICSAIKYNYTDIKNAVMLNGLLIKLKKNPSKQMNSQIENELLCYLKDTNPASVWWDYAYETYSDVCRKNGAQPKSKKNLFSLNKGYMKPITSITLNNNKTIYLSQKLKDIKETFGQTGSIPIVKERRIMKYLYPDYGIDVIGTDEVIAIILNGLNSPGLVLKPGGRQLRIGITKNKLEEILGGMKKNYLVFPGIDEKIFLYDQIGVAFQFENEIVKKIIITQTPTEF